MDSTESNSTKEPPVEELIKQFQQELKESREERTELRETIKTLVSPKKPRPKAQRHDITPKIRELVQIRGYATCRDAESMSLCNTNWQRCLVDIIRLEPTWRSRPW